MVTAGSEGAVYCACLNLIRLMGGEVGVGAVVEEEGAEHWGSGRLECGPETEDDCRRNLNWS